MTPSGLRTFLLLSAWACVACPTGSARAGTRLYDNTGNPANTYYSAQGGAETLDDLHLTSEATLDSVVFEYFDPASGGAFSATVNLYRNPSGLDLGTTPYAGPFVRSGLPRGRGSASIALPHGLGAIADLWVGVQFTSTTAGLIINSVPSVGSSHDLYLENGGFYWFGGNPKANFGLRIVGIPASVSVDNGSGAGHMSLAPIQPNPFRAGSTIRYTIARHGRVRLDVLDLSGRHVCALVNEMREAGDYAARWSGQDDSGRLVAAGVYFVRLESEASVASTRVVFAP